MEWFNKKRWPVLTIDEIRKRARILVIDDQEFYYLPLFRKDEYQVDKWDDVEDLQKLEQGFYDIILLDIQGVGKKQSEEQGLGILRHLRRVSPAQIIIAYSNADWSLKYKDFFDMADCTMVKTADYVDFKRKVDELLTQRFSIGFYVERVWRLTADYLTDKQKAQGVVEKAILKNAPDKLEKYLQTRIDNKDVILMALQVVQTAITIITL